MNILAIAATNHKRSINRALVTHVAETFKATFHPDATINYPDLNDYELPIFSIERHQTGMPSLAQAFYDQITQADFIMISYAEHNGNFTSAWKNLFDWMSMIDQKVFQNKPMLAMATSPGANGAQSVLDLAMTTAPFAGANIKASLSIPAFNDNFDMKSGVLVNQSLVGELQAALEKLNT